MADRLAREANHRPFIPDLKPRITEKIQNKRLLETAQATFGLKCTSQTYTDHLYGLVVASDTQSSHSYLSREEPTPTCEICRTESSPNTLNIELEIHHITEALASIINK